MIDLGIYWWIGVGFAAVVGLFLLWDWVHWLRIRKRGMEHLEQWIKEVSDD